jgi:hypothetical protein
VLVPLRKISVSGPSVSEVASASEPSKFDPEYLVAQSSTHFLPGLNLLSYGRDSHLKPILTSGKEITRFYEWRRVYEVSRGAVAVQPEHPRRRSYQKRFDRGREYHLRGLGTEEIQFMESRVLDRALA